MAGQYQRFRLEGYKIPKYLLPWGNYSVLATILNELNREKIFDNILLVANHRDDAYFPHVEEIMRTHQIPISNLIISNDTSGQAATAMLGVDQLAKHISDEAGPIIFHNIDTILLKRKFSEIRLSLMGSSGYIDIFSAQNHEYSYVILNDENQVLDIAEKVVISSYASSGLYGFQSLNLFKKYFTPKDIYITSIYKRMIEAGEIIMAGECHKESDTIVLGTPSEYLNASSTLLKNLQSRA